MKMGKACVCERDRQRQRRGGEGGKRGTEGDRDGQCKREGEMRTKKNKMGWKRAKKFVSG